MRKIRIALSILVTIAWLVFSVYAARDTEETFYRGAFSLASLVCCFNSFNTVCERLMEDDQPRKDMYNV